LRFEPISAIVAADNRRDGRGKTMAEDETRIAAAPSRSAQRSTTMRLVISGLIFLVTSLDFRFGQPGTPLHIAGLTAGILLAGTVLADYFWLRRRNGAGRETGQQREPLHTGGGGNPDQ
jgi:hypothetical protein